MRVGGARVASIPNRQARALRVAMTDAERPRGKGRKRGDSNAPWAKIKYDRQIVAIAKVAGATTIYSDDSDIRAIAAEAKIAVKGLADLPLPPQSAQAELNLPAPRGRLLDLNEPPTETEK